MKSKLKLALCVLSVLLIATACSGRQKQWETAHAADTLESYQGFLKTYPDGEFTAQARARIHELEEARDWKLAVEADNANAFEQFVTRYPESRMNDEARIRIESYGLAMKNNVSEAGEAVAPETVVPPSPKIETPAPGVTAPRTHSRDTPHDSSKVTRGYRVQLGAFKNGEKQAMGEWRRLQKAYPQWLGSLSPSIKLATTVEGHAYRLQAGMTDEARAREICKALKAKNEACVVVLP